MFTIVQKQWVLGLILIGVAIGMSTFPMNAQKIEPQKQPGDYFWLEVASGSVGALAGGFVTAYVGIAIVGHLYPCKSETSFGDCTLFGVTVTETAFLIGAPIGSAVGVVMAGSSKRVHGNILMTFAGTMAGEAIALFILAANGFPPGSILLRILLRANAMLFILLGSPLVLSTALGATLGYNLNATVEPVVLSPTNQGIVLVGLKAHW